MKKIWALLSIDNNYDQPPNNLVAWWAEKPTLESLAITVGWEFPGASDEETVRVVNLWSKKKVDYMNTEYRLEELKEGIV